MSWIQTYKLDPSRISVIGETEIRGLTSVTIEGGGDEVAIATHGKPWVHSMFVDNLQYTITIESHTHFKTIAPGDVITTMILKGAARNQGTSVNSQEKFDITFAENCGGVVTNVEHSINHAGASTWKLTMKTYSKDGSTIPVAILS